MTDPKRILSSVTWVLGLAGAGVASFFTLRAAGIAGELPPRSGGDLLVDTLTLTSTKEAFVRGIMSAAARVRPNMGVASRGLLAAWAALESNWGKTRQAKLAFNLWNVGKGSWTGPTRPGGDLEYRPGSSTAKKITQDWRQYATIDAAVADLLNLIERSRYANYREGFADLMAGNPLFATRLGVLDNDANGVKVRVDNRANTAGYYTEARSIYQRGVSKLWLEVQAIIAKEGLQGLKC